MATPILSSNLKSSICSLKYRLRDYVEVVGTRRYYDVFLASALNFYLSFGPRIQAKVCEHAFMPGIIIQRSPLDPLFIGHRFAPGEEGLGIGPRGMPQLPRAAFDYIPNDFGHHRRRPWLSQGCVKHSAEAPHVRIRGFIF
jgi:hypothetical protein